MDRPRGGSAIKIQKRLFARRALESRGGNLVYFRDQMCTESIQVKFLGSLAFPL